MITIPDETIIERLSGRRVCVKCGATYHITHNPPQVAGRCDACGEAVVQREDDQAETVGRRLATYAAQTAPVVAFYEAKDLVRRFDNAGAPSETVANVEASLAAVR